MEFSEPGGNESGREDACDHRPTDPTADTLHLIRTTFSGRDRLVERAFRQSESFRDLCGDYHSCLAALHRWRQLEAPETAPRWREYSELLIELGEEIQTWLEAMEANPSHTNNE